MYYVGLLAGENDQASVERTGEGREVNRHNFTLEEIDEAMNKEVIQRLLRLIDFRNQHPAFDGRFSVIDTNSQNISLRWENGEHHCQLEIDLQGFKTVIAFTEMNGAIQEYLV